MAVAFEDIREGHAEALHVEITAPLVEQFAALTGDRNPLHMEDDYARATPWRRRVVHGMLSASFFSTLIGMRIPGEGALWLDQTLEFARPVFIGDRLEVRATVKQKVLAERILVLELVVSNQRSEIVLSGTAKVRAPQPIHEAKAPPGEAAEPRVALVTGASRGIGAAIARELARRQFRVAINYRERKAEAETVSAGIRRDGGTAWTVQADVTAPGAIPGLVRDVVGTLGGLHVLVNNAAIPYPSVSFERLAYEEVERQLAINLEAPFRLIQAALPHFFTAGEGVVINILSEATALPPAHAAHYVAAKCALEGLTRALAVEYGPRNIRFNMVSPGLVPTELTQSTSERARKVYAMQTPLRRLADPEDIARVVSFLAGDGARYLTGINIPVAGGRMLG
jgi:3-oxoacyl-[acyl-carrier protein] reductase